MLNDRFILTSKGSNITVKSGFFGKLAHHHKEASKGINLTGLNFIIREDLSLDSFESGLRGAIRNHSFLTYLQMLVKNKLGTFLTVIISLVIILLIALLSIHGSLTYDLFSSGEGSNIFNFNSFYLYLLLSIVILLFLIISPRIILGEYNNLFEWVNTRFSTDSRIIHRLARELELLHRTTGEEKLICVWNPLVAGMDGWACRQLLPALALLSSEVHIMIRSDEKDAITEVMKAIEPEQIFVRHSVDVSEEEKNAFPFDLLSSWEKECLHCILFSSSINLPKDWMIDVKTEEVVISRELAERVYHLYEPKLSATARCNISFEKFLGRCTSDYALLNISDDQRSPKFILRDRSLEKNLDQPLMEAIGDTVKNNLGTLSLNITDPLALVILIGMAGSEHALDTRKIDLVREFIRNVKRIENYRLISQYWKHISTKNKQKDESHKLGLLQFLDVRTLTDLAACFVNSGMYDEAFEVYGILENIYPAKIAIEIADLKDSLGEYREALQILLATDEDWVRSGIIEDRSLILELYLNISWVIVSGRFEDHKKEGYDYLDKTENILRKLPNTENYLLFLTRFYNTKANYHEWEKDYEQAIKNYQKALKLPGTILRKSSLLSNWGIAERLLGKNTEDLAARRNHFQTSRSNITTAVNMKKSIGEKNQIPGSSHNLSETLVELAAITEDRADKLNILAEADQVTSYALDILDDLNSNKRRGRLLTEKYIAQHMLKEMGEKSSVEETKESLIRWFESEDKESYDYRETTALLNRFGIKI